MSGFGNLPKSYPWGQQDQTFEGPDTKARLVRHLKVAQDVGGIAVAAAIIGLFLLGASRFTLCLVLTPSSLLMLALHEIRDQLTGDRTPILRAWRLLARIVRRRPCVGRGQRLAEPTDEPIRGEA